eukprot:4744779-Pleurochrysis_carterae.AAC.3
MAGGSTVQAILKSPECASARAATSQQSGLDQLMAYGYACLNVMIDECRIAIIVRLDIHCLPQAAAA